MAIILDKNTIQTRYNYYDLEFNEPSLVDINDIAHALSNICRFNGHTKIFYCVAAHSCLVHDLAVDDGYEKDGLHFLLHDAHETYCTDVSRPNKRFMKEQFNFDFNAKISDPIDEAIWTKYSISPPDKDLQEIIKFYDNKALFTEKEHLFPNKMDWGWSMEIVPLEQFSSYMDNTKNWKDEFLYRFNSYF